MGDFYFNAWVELAKTAPDEFERRRRDVVESHISSSGNVRLLRGLQCNIDMERVRAPTPLRSCLRLSNLMFNMLSVMLTEASEAVSLSSHVVRVITASVSKQSQTGIQSRATSSKSHRRQIENHASAESNSQGITHLQGLAKELDDAVRKFKV